MQCARPNRDSPKVVCLCAMGTSHSFSFPLLFCPTFCYGISGVIVFTKQ